MVTLEEQLGCVQVAKRAAESDGRDVGVLPVGQHRDRLDENGGLDRIDAEGSTRAPDEEDGRPRLRPVAGPVVGKPPM